MKNKANRKVWPRQKKVIETFKGFRHKSAFICLDCKLPRRRSGGANEEMHRGEKLITGFVCFKCAIKRIAKERANVR